MRKAGQGGGAVGGAGTSPRSALIHSVALGKAYLLFWVSVFPSVRWGIKEVGHSQKILSCASILITGS